MKKQSEFFDVVMSRRSIRRYHEKAVPDEVLERVLTAAIWAPSAHNRQPWRFAVLQGAQSKQMLAAAMGARLRRDLQADGAPQPVIEKDVNRSYARISRAPVVIVVCLSMEDMDAYPDVVRQRNEWIMAAQSTAMAGQNLLLAARAEGLGGCWMCAPLFCPDVVRDTLALPNDWEPQGLITLGYPAKSKDKPREPLASRVHFVP